MNEVKVWLESEEEEVRLLSVLLGSISYFNKKKEWSSIFVRSCVCI